MPYDVDIEELEYQSVDSNPYLGRLYRPRGAGPFPFLVQLHGGAWKSKDRFDYKGILEQLARLGLCVFSIDFRLPPTYPYPAALADVNFAIRWAKANADRLNTRPELVGIMGASSGGHLAVLAALRPNDPRYTGTPGPTSSEADASVLCAVAFWPVISPLGRYQVARELLPYGRFPNAKNLMAGHESFWITEEAMSEGDPIAILGRGEPTALPPIFYTQAPGEMFHPIAHLAEFASLYRQAGGQIEVVLPDIAPPNVLSASIEPDPTGDIASDTLSRVATFVQACAASRTAELTETASR